MPRFRRWIFGLREALSTAFWVGRGVAAIEERSLVGMTRQTWATSNGKRQTAMAFEAGPSLRFGMTTKI